MKNCYGYMEAREEAGDETKQAILAKKVRKGKSGLEDVISKLEACMDDDTCASNEEAAKL
jgi:hypothetical protein